MIDPNDYWVNNPLITPVNKALMYDNDIDGAVSRERERIIALIEANVCNIYGEFCASEDSCGSRDALISLIEVDNK